MRRTALLLVALVASGCGATDDTATPATTTTAPAVTAPGPAAPVEAQVLLDVRTPEEFAAGHLSGAVNIDVADPNFAERIAALDPSLSYLVYCRSGNRAADAVDAMAAAGFDDVTNGGGLQDLAAAGYPLE